MVLLVFQLFPPPACETSLAVFWWKLAWFISVMMMYSYLLIIYIYVMEEAADVLLNIISFKILIYTTFLFPVLGEAGQVPLSIHVRKQGVVVTHDMARSISITAENTLFHFNLCILKIYHMALA